MILRVGNAKIKEKFCMNLISATRTVTIHLDSPSNCVKGKMHKTSHG